MLMSTVLFVFQKRVHFTKTAVHSFFFTVYHFTHYMQVLLSLHLVLVGSCVNNDGNSKKYDHSVLSLGYDMLP